MKIVKLIVKNAMRHKLRTVLTATGIAIAIFAFSLLSTVIDAYFTGVNSSSNTRLVTRNRVSLSFSMPLAYEEKIAKLPGVTNVSISQWFGATYIDRKNFFAQFAVEPGKFLPLFPEYILSEKEKSDFLKQRNSCIVGAKLAEKYGWKPGDTFRLVGTIFPGNWDFVIRGIYHGADKGTNETTMFFHWKYLDESLRQTAPSRAGNVSGFYVGIADPEKASEISRQIDAMFNNSLAETKTESEREFRMQFVSMVGTIITAIRIISIVVVAIILLVMANTMAMTARERVHEYAVLKTLGFRPKHIVGLIFGESGLIAVSGGILGLMITVPLTHAFARFLTDTLGNFFPIFELSETTVIFAFVSSLLVGVLAAIFPTLYAVKTRIADGLRYIG